MKMSKLEKWLLLEQSGELSPRQLRQLNRALSASQEGQALRRELGLLKKSVLTPVAEPSPWTVAKITARLREEQRPAVRMSFAGRPALALAACLTLVLGIWAFHGKQASSASDAVFTAAGVDVWDDPLGEDLDKLENLIVAISGDSTDVMEM